MHTLVKRIFVQPHRWSASLPIDFCGPRRAACNEYEYIPFYSLNHIPAFVALLLCALLPAWHSMMHTHSYNGYKRSSNMLRIYECEIQNSRAMEKCQRGANANATHTFFSLLLPELGRSSFSSFIQRMQLAHNRQRSNNNHEQINLPATGIRVENCVVGAFVHFHSLRLPLWHCIPRNLNGNWNYI